MRVCLVCSSGGHFTELYRLHDAWRDHDRFWVTFDSPDTRSLLAGEQVLFAASPTNRDLCNLLRNLVLAWRVLGRERPAAMISTGAGVAVPFLLAARLRGVPTIYVESLSRVHTLSLTGRAAYRLADEFLVQWPELAARLPHARYAGRVL
ncbi:MAG: PssD/Cps14F family polysaccharide biosynthesis glycosyltransferase [Candidatus Krumholzibacteriia bacterium]